MEIRKDEICNVVEEAIMPDENEIFETESLNDLKFCYACFLTASSRYISSNLLLESIASRDCVPM